MKKKAIVVDLDGTICNVDHRRHHVSGEYQQKDFDKFYERMDDDPPNNWCVNLVRIYKNHNYEIFFVSGRMEQYRERTQKWLLEHVGINPVEYYLYMRPDGVLIDDRIIKETIYREHIEPMYEVEIVIDDRKKVVDRWRELGLVCLHCYPGDF